MFIEFSEFWSGYPRKQAKLDAQKAWSKMDDCRRQKAIEMLPEHCKRWDDPQYIPLAASWLRGERYEDEFPAEVQKPVKKVVTVAWWASQGGIIEQGRSLGLMARPGESDHEFKQRIVDKMQKAA